MSKDAAVIEGFAKDVASVQRIEAVPRILDVICHATGMGFAAVARVTEQRWIACAVRDDIAFGLKPGGELEIRTTICNEIRDSGQGVVIDRVSSDPHYCGHPAPAMYGFQSYIAMPIRRGDGSFFGTLCAIDPEPARVNTPETIEMFRLFAELIATHLDTLDRLASSEARLSDERHTSELRDQFIAVLGHDLRNPLASINAGTNLLLRMPLGDEAGKIVKLMRNSVERMSRLIDNVLDLARGRLGGGLILDRRRQPLEPLLIQVVAELKASHPDRAIETQIVIGEDIDCDAGRMARLVSNLLGNALAYGAPGKPVTLRAVTAGEQLEVSVANAGEPIPPAIQARLFEPFTRGDGPQMPQGLGLGLYIAMAIAKAHGGTLGVVSNAEETRFTFRMPLADK